MSGAVPGIESGRLLTWDRRTSGPAFALAVIYLIAWSVLVLNEDLSSEWKVALLASMIVIWVAFIVDYIVRISLTQKGLRLRFAFSHPLDLLAVILPFMRPVAQITHLNSVPLFQRRAAAAQRARILLLAGAFVIVFVYTIALAVYNVERDAPGATIDSFGNAIWWACVTLFTVGYGDTFPITVPGRVFAVMLMMGGFAIIGVASAVVGSYLTERVKLQTDKSEKTPQ
jgi:voltage-gated potassium channel